MTSIILKRVGLSQLLLYCCKTLEACAGHIFAADRVEDNSPAQVRIRNDSARGGILIPTFLKTAGVPHLGADKPRQISTRNSLLSHESLITNGKVHIAGKELFGKTVKARAELP